MFLVVPPIIPGPVGIAITVVSAIVSIFSAFRGGSLKEVKNALNALRGQLAGVAVALMNFAWKIARGVGWIIQAIQSFWVKVFQPLLEHIARIARRVNQIVDRVLRPYLEALRRIREAIDLIYNAVFRPVIQMIDTIRRITALGRILHIKGAANLDRRLQRLEGKIAAPIRALYAKVSEIGGWMNILVDARGVLQAAILLNSLYQHQGPLVNLWYNAQQGPVDPGARQARLDSLEPPTIEVTEQELEAFARTGAGSLDEQATEALKVMRDILVI